jgi:5S rRNA maturation endonuclease (ribonuclease M5)
MDTVTDKQEILREFRQSIDCPVIVEGDKDEQALQRLGVEDIIILNKGQTLLETVEALKDEKELIILTDMDQQGKILRKKLLKLFQLYGIHEKKRPRELFAQLRLSHVEGL